jgi:glycosyltransferase involved in cell wall biosynthesis
MTAPSSSEVIGFTTPASTAAPPLFAGRGGPSARARLRVVHCLDSLEVGGTELNAVRTLEQLDRDRFDPVLMCLRAEGALRTRVEQAGVPLVEFPISGLLSRSAAREAARFTRFLRKHRVDVVHAHDQYNNLFACAAARLAGVPLIIGSRRWSVAHMQTRYRVANALGLRFAHVVLTNSSALASELSDADGIAPSRIVTISNFVDDRAFDILDDAGRRSALAALGVPPGAIVLGVVARLVPVKDHATLLRAFAKLAQSWPALHLVVVGDGPLRSDLERDAVGRGLGHRVHFAGLRPHLPNPNGMFDFSVLSSVSEGFPNSVIEAMAAGRPIVATAVGGTVDAVEDGRTGLLVPAGDADALAAAIASLLRDPTRARTLGDAARQAARSRYQASTVMSQLGRVYERAREGRRGAAAGRRFVQEKLDA